MIAPDSLKGKKMRAIVAVIFLLTSIGVFADEDDRLYFEKDENFSVAPAKVKQIIRTTGKQDMEIPAAGLGPVFHNDKYEFDENGRKTSRSPGFAYWDPNDGPIGYREGPLYKNFYDETGRIVEGWESWYGDFSWVTKTVYDYSGVDTKVTERHYRPDGDTEELRYVEWIYSWQDGRLLSKNEFYAPVWESRSEYRYYDCSGAPWDGKLKKVTTTHSDYDKFFRPIKPKISEKLLTYDEKGRLKEEIFISISTTDATHPQKIDFIKIYDERGDLVEIKAYYSTGILASREEFKHFYEKINGIELRTRTERKMYRVEWRDRGDDTDFKTETLHLKETITYKYEFWPK